MRPLLCMISLAVLSTCCLGQAIDGKWHCNSEDVKHTALDWTLTIQSKTHLEVNMAGGRDNDHFTLDKAEFNQGIFRGVIMLNPPDDTVELFLRLDGNTLNGGFAGKNSGTGPFLCRRVS